MASLFCILFAYKKLLQSFRLSTELSLLEQEEHSLNQYVEEAKAHYEETKSFRHDIRNHITVLKKLLKGGKLEQAINYIEDICIILSNALDNAIHACKNMDADTEKYIHVSGCIQGDFLMMEIENSFCGKGMLKEGTGLSNIKTEAEKYGGAMSVETQGDVFVLHVLLIIPQQPEGISQQVN